MTNTFSISAPSGFGIVEKVFLVEDDVPLDTAQQRHELLNLHRAALVQEAFLDPRLQAAGRVEPIPLPRLMDLVFDETWQLLQNDLDAVTYMVNSVEVHGQTIRYRDVTFLFSDLGWKQSPDFAVWRLPEVDRHIPWPVVASISGQAAGS
ncbi:MAG: hypothetical protein ACI379_13140 [Nocardioides sp.]|uniref:hypothetical protein n=1 Tax=Nocardioides sp. TaxID=35761 RepID=UPI003F05F1D5